MALISCQNLGLALGGKVLLDTANLQIERGERVGLLGRNGEGKSTLLKIVARELAPDGGEVVHAQGLRVARLTQRVPEELSGSIDAIIRSGLSEHSRGDHPVQRVCSLLKLDPTASFTTCSGGEKRRTLLGRALVAEPDLLLLDEPTNHLDIESIQWLESYLSRFPGSLLFVTHDRAFLQRLATRIIELDRGCLTSWDCDYPTYLRRKEAALEAEQQTWQQFDKKLAREEAWLRQGVKARRTRNEGRVRALKQLRAERAARRERVGEAGINLQLAPRSGRKVIAAKHLDYAYHGTGDAEQLILRDLSTTILRGDKVGVIGPNGCGKTTLLNLLLGRLPPDGGTIEHGTSIEVAYFDQHRHQLDGEQTVADNVANGSDTLVIDGKSRHVIAYLEDFLFPPDRARMPAKFLSGGERNRLLLARLFTRPSNVLVLDEPTNDLDAETLELLEARLLQYEGTVLLVSHDRQFLDNLCSSTLVFEGEGRVREYVGGYSDWQRVVQRQAAPVVSSTMRTPVRTRTRKFSNREREEWENLPARIEAMEKEQAELVKQMADPAFFRQAPDTIKRDSDRAQKLHDEVERAYTRWAELDELKS